MVEVLVTPFSLGLAANAPLRDPILHLLEQRWPGWSLLCTQGRGEARVPNGTHRRCERCQLAGGAWLTERGVPIDTKTEIDWFLERAAADPPRRRARRKVSLGN